MESDSTYYTKRGNDSDDDAVSSKVSSNEDEQGNGEGIIDNPPPPPATNDENDDNTEPFFIEDYDEAIENLFRAAPTEEIEETVLLEYDIVRAADAVPPELQLTMEGAEKRISCQFPTGVELNKKVSFTTLEGELEGSEANLIDDTADDKESPQPGPSRQCKIRLRDDVDKDKNFEN